MNSGGTIEDIKIQTENKDFLFETVSRFEHLRV